jgi:hypothetical protein
VTEIVKTPEFAFTGDTTSQFILDDRNKDVLDAKLLVMEVCGLSIPREHDCKVLRAL